MAKIGGSSQGDSRFGRDAPQRKGLENNSGQAESAHEYPQGTLFWVTNRLERYLGEHHDNFGIGYSGAFNVETATAEIRGARFETCDHYDELTAHCDSCGRRVGNNIRLLSGSGDGVYSGINYWAHQTYSEDKVNPELLASFYLFDSGSAHSSGIDARGWESPMQFFFQCAAQYQDLDGSIAGDIKTGDDGFWLAEARAGHGSRDAQVNHWGSENRDYRVIAFSELAEPSRSSAIEDRPYRPRILLILGKRIAEAIFHPGELKEIDWASQPHKWGQMSVQANIGGGGNATACLNNDGIYWRTALERHVENIGESDAMFRRYQEQVLGLFLQGALLGNDRSRELLGTFLNNPQTSQSDDLALARALAARGWTLTDEARRTVSSVKNS